jgi:hypothetical protein
MAKRQERILHEIRKEAAHQLRGFPREFKRQLGGFGREAGYQLTNGWGHEFAHQIFGVPRNHRHGR